MKHVFISHAGKDSAEAQKLYDELRNVGHDVRIDLHELKLGDDSIQFMNDAIANAHTVVILFSENTPQAKWQNLEINAAVWNETAQGGGKVIVLKLDDTQLPPLLGPKVYGSLKPDDRRATLQKLCAEITSGKSETTLVCEALREGSANPFWRVRAEYFEQMPALLADAFSPPEAAKARILEEMMPCFLEGSRGSGKTMLLLSLRARIYASRPNAGKSLGDLFGCYVRLERGAFCNAGLRLVRDDPSRTLDQQLLVQLADTFAQEFYLTLHESLISELLFCARERLVSLDAGGETLLARAIAQAMYGPSHESSVGHLEDLLAHFADMHRRLAEFVRRKYIYQEAVSVPFAYLDLDLFKRVLAVVKRHVPTLAESQFTILLDEYENLLPFQKIVVNSLIKFGPPSLSAKVARKVGTEEISSTTVGQELQESHDYNRISLIYSVEDAADFGRYLSLLESMVAKLLASHGLPATPLAELLPPDDRDEISQTALQQEVLALLRLSQEEFEQLDEPTKAAKLTYYKEAAVYRELYGKPGRRTAKRFSGHKDLAFISSGVIRFFQEILGMAYHLQVTSGACAAAAIHPTFQSQAVHTVSGHNLATLSRNVETYGEQLKYFLLDLGDCLRRKLLRHTSEPEAARIAIKDPQLLQTEKYALLNTFLNLGVKEGVFQTVAGRPGIRPKHVDDPQPVEFNIARIFAPALQISPRLRWTSQVACSDLLGLLDGDERRKTKTKLLRLWAKVEDKTQVKSNSLFAEEDDHEGTV